MLNPIDKVALFMQDNLDSDYGKMGFGVMRYGQNPVCCVVDSAHAGRRVGEVCGVSAAAFDIPVVATVAEAAGLGARVLIIGVAPSGGRAPAAWDAPLREALALGLNLVNGLHDDMNARYADALTPGRWIWDVRRPAFTPPIAAGRAAELNNKRVLMVGTDMAVGKMTAGLEIHGWLRAHGVDAAFIATGQIGITLTGRGIPLDAHLVDHACGAVEQAVLEARAHPVVIIEGQGSLAHPGSSATLPLLRGSSATHLIMCHRAGATHLRAPSTVAIPPLNDFIRLNESLAHAGGSLTPATTIGIALNTAHMDATTAAAAITAIEHETGLPTADVVRNNAGKLGRLLV